MNDDELFRNATRDVRPLRGKSPAQSVRAKPKPAPKAHFARAERQAVLRESLEPVADAAILETGEEIAFRRPGVPDTVLRKLRRGHFSVHDELDLHGLTSPQARAA